VTITGDDREHIRRSTGPIHGILGWMLTDRTSILDETNVRLLGELQEDARMSLAELGRRVGLSAPAVAERMRRLEQAGVIAGYRVEIDPRALGYTLGAIIRIRPAPRQLAAVADLARESPEVIECHRVTGDDCYVMVAYVRDVVHLEELIDGFAAYGQTTSSIMQSSPVPRRGLRPA
jgi:Lrp/AsnC family leucine-responsive transcriptional regulator